MIPWAGPWYTTWNHLSKWKDVNTSCDYLLENKKQKIFTSFKQSKQRKQINKQVWKFRKACPWLLNIKEDDFWITTSSVLKNYAHS